MSRTERSRWRAYWWFIAPVVVMLTSAGWHSALSAQRSAGPRTNLAPTFTMKVGAGLNSRKRSVSPSVIRIPQFSALSTQHSALSWPVARALGSDSAIRNPQSAILSPPTAVAPEVEAVLDRLEKADAELKDLRAKVRYSVLQLVKANDDDPEDVQHHVGTIKFLKQPEPTAFFIHFEKRSDGTTWANDAKQWFIFDGEWLTTAKENGKTVEREQIVRPGEKSEFYKLGEGPFPLPFGQKKADVLEHFYVQLASPSQDDPKFTDHLICTTKPDSSLAKQFKQIDLFISNDTKSGLSGLSIKIIAENVKDQTRETITFSEIRRNKGLSRDKDFSLPPYTKKWQKSERPLPAGN